MAWFSSIKKQKRAVAAAGFHSSSLNYRRTKRNQDQVSLFRRLFSAVLLSLSAIIVFVGLYYIPAFVQPKQIISIASGDPAALKTYDFDRKSKANELFGSFSKLFHMDRAYMKPGHSINIKYDLPKGAYANLNIVQCRQAWVVEIFKCDAVSQFSTKTKRQSGVESFALKQGGFYYFQHETVGIPAGEPFRIVWERGQ